MIQTLSVYFLLPLHVTSECQEIPIFQLHWGLYLVLEVPKVPAVVHTQHSDCHQGEYPVADVIVPYRCEEPELWDLRVISLPISIVLPIQDH